MAVAVAAAVVMGAIIGSFLSVVAHRVPERQSIVSPGSACPVCETPLRWRDNVPILSWVLARGRCAHCGAPISPRYIALEAVTGLAFGVVVLAGGVDRDLVVELPFVTVLVVLAAIDLERRLVPNPIVAVAAVYGVVALAASDPGALPEHALAGVGAFVAFLLIALAYPAGMGMGDVKLAGVMGLYLGIAVIPALLVAFLAGSVVGGVMMARGGVGERKSAVPFVPFLALGGFVGVVAGHELVDLYASRFL